MSGGEVPQRMVEKLPAVCLAKNEFEDNKTGRVPNPAMFF